MLVNPPGLDVQLYVSPLTEVAPIFMEVPEQIEVDEIVEADGKGLTVIFTLSVLLHPVAVIFSVNL